MNDKKAGRAYFSHVAQALKFAAKVRQLGYIVTYSARPRRSIVRWHKPYTNPWGC